MNVISAASAKRWYASIFWTHRLKIQRSSSLCVYTISCSFMHFISAVSNACSRKQISKRSCPCVICCMCVCVRERVCVCVCEFVCVSVYKQIRVHVCESVGMCVYEYGNINIHVSRYIYINICICVYTLAVRGVSNEG